MNIGSAIREIRQRRGITIAQICEGTGLSKGFMSQVENNKTSPSISTLEMIANFLNVPLPYLLLEQKDRLKIIKKKSVNTVCMEKMNKELSMLRSKVAFA